VTHTSGCSPLQLITRCSIRNIHFLFWRKEYGNVDASSCCPASEMMSTWCVCFLLLSPPPPKRAVWLRFRRCPCILNKSGTAAFRVVHTGFSQGLIYVVRISWRLWSVQNPSHDYYSAKPYYTLCNERLIKNYRVTFILFSLCLHETTGWAKKVTYCTCSISLLNIDQFFTIFFTSRLWKKFATQWHAHHTYYVATLPRKI